MFILPELGYEFDALEPHIDAQTMQIHHDKHHATYVEKLNKALEAYPDLQAKNIDELLSDMNSVPAEIKTAVQNNGGGHLNHSIFWIQLTPGGSNVPEGDIAIAIDDIFGGFEALKEQMSTAATNQFGSGWAWLAMKPDGSLFVQGYPNQNSPLMDGNHPIMGIDVWEHAYYLKYQNKRADYVTAIWNLINWDKVGELYDSLRKL